LNRIQGLPCPSRPSCLTRRLMQAGQKRCYCTGHGHTRTHPRHPSRTSSRRTFIPAGNCEPHAVPASPYPSSALRQAPLRGHVTMTNADIGFHDMPAIVTMTNFPSIAIRLRARRASMSSASTSAWCSVVSIVGFIPKGSRKRPGAGKGSHWETRPGFWMRLSVGGSSSGGYFSPACGLRRPHSGKLALDEGKVKTHRDFWPPWRLQPSAGEAGRPRPLTNLLPNRATVRIVVPYPAHQAAQIPIRALLAQTWSGPRPSSSFLTVTASWSREGNRGAGKDRVSRSTSRF